MGLLDRITNVFRSYANYAMDQAEDPAKMLELAIADMEDNLCRGKIGLVAAITEENRCRVMWQNNIREADEWDAKVKQAVAKDADDLAREALKRRNLYREYALEYQKQYDMQKVDVAEVRKSLLELESRVSAARAKKELLVVRQKSAQARKQISEQLAGIGKAGSAFVTFDRMEQKVATLEHQADATQQVHGDDLEEKFRGLGADKDVEAELAALKAGQ